MRILLFVFLLVGMGFAQFPQAVKTVPDTSSLKTMNAGEGTIMSLRGYSSSDYTGAGQYITADSAHAEGTIAFNHPTRGMQWVSVNYLHEITLASDQVIPADTTALKAVAASNEATVLQLKQIASNYNAGGGAYVLIDSTYPETSKKVYGSAVAGKQWVDQYLHNYGVYIVNAPNYTDISDEVNAAYDVVNNVVLIEGMWKAKNIDIPTGGKLSSVGKGTNRQGIASFSTLIPSSGSNLYAVSDGDTIINIAALSTDISISDITFWGADGVTADSAQAKHAINFGYASGYNDINRCIFRYFGFWKTDVQRPASQPLNWEGTVLDVAVNADSAQQRLTFNKCVFRDNQIDFYGAEGNEFLFNQCNFLNSRVYSSWLSNHRSAIYELCSWNWNDDDYTIPNIGLYLEYARMITLINPYVELSASTGSAANRDSSTLVFLSMDTSEAPHPAALANDGSQHNNNVVVVSPRIVSIDAVYPLARVDSRYTHRNLFKTIGGEVESADGVGGMPILAPLNNNNRFRFEDVSLRTSTATQAVNPRTIYGYNSDVYTFSATVFYDPSLEVIDDIDLSGTFSIKGQAAADADVTGWGQIWVNSTDSSLNFTDHSGADFPLQRTGTDAFTTTATSDVVTITGVTSNSLFNLTVLDATPVADDMLSYVASTNTLTVYRPAGTTSGLTYSWQWLKK